MNPNRPEDVVMPTILLIAAGYLRRLAAAPNENPVEGEVDDELYSHGAPLTVSMPSSNFARQVMIRITQKVYQDVLDALTRFDPEMGGILVGPRGDELVTHFWLDETGQSTPTSFTLGHARLKEQMAELRAADLEVKGFVHSHPAGIHSPSRGDLAYVRSVFANPKNKSAAQFLLPIVCDGRFWPFVVVRTADGISLEFATLVLV